MRKLEAKQPSSTIVRQKTRKETYLDRVERIVAAAKSKVVQAVNVAMVYTYYEVGRIIVEEEQCGSKRARYGAQVLKNVSKRLTDRFGHGWSVENLKLMRRFSTCIQIG